LWRGRLPTGALGGRHGGARNLTVQFETGNPLESSRGRRSCVSLSSESMWKGAGGKRGGVEALGGTASAVCGRGIGLGTRTGCTPTALGAAPPPRGVGDTSSDGPGVRLRVVRVASPLSPLLPPSSPPAVGVVLERVPPVGACVDGWRPRVTASWRRGRIPPSRGWTGNGWGIGIPPRMVGFQTGLQTLQLSAQGGDCIRHPFDLRRPHLAGLAPAPNRRLGGKKPECPAHSQGGRVLKRTWRWKMNPHGGASSTG
jgi:hypothetical protein